jgi:hypothetical protein
VLLVSNMNRFVPCARGRGPHRLLAVAALALLAGCQSNKTTAAPAGDTPAGDKAAQPAAALAPAHEQPVPVAVRAQGQLGIGLGHLYIDIEPPKGAKLTPDAPISVKASGGIGLTFPKELKGPLSSYERPLKLPIEVADGATGPAQVEVAYFWCTEGDSATCRREQALLDVDLDLTGSAPGGEAAVRHVALAEAM